MDLVLKIDDKELESAILNDAKNIDREQLTTIMAKAVESYLSRPDVMESFIFQKSYYSNEKKPQDFIVRLFSNFDNKDISNLRNKVIEYMNEHYPEIVMQAMVQAFSGALMTRDFEMTLKNSIEVMHAKITNIEERLGGN